jgi:protein TonB
MRDRNKNNIIRFPDFFRYSGKKMSGKERNSFERELQRDPFAEDAEEGLASITPKEALKDISTLQKQLKKRTEGRQKLILYRIAASVAVLMIVSSVFIVIERKSTPKQIASHADRIESLEITESKPITEPAEKKELSEQPVLIREKEAVRSVVQIKNPEALIIPDSKSHAIIAGSIGKEAKESEAKADTPAIKSDSSLMELNEIVVTAIGISGEKSEMETQPEGYVPPSPAGGKSDFDIYIRENLQRPDTLNSGQKAIVVLSFSVHTDGSIDSIKIIRSPGKPFSDEAIRLLRSGPSWHPAVNNGQVIEDQVRLRIVFK